MMKSTGTTGPQYQSVPDSWHTHNSRQRINLLPVEVLNLIFLSSVPSISPWSYRIHIPSILNLSAVCSLWRDIVLSMPSLWNHINFPSNSSLRELCFSRSREALIDVEFRQAGRLVYDNMLMDWAWPESNEDDAAPFAEEDWQRRESVFKEWHADALAESKKALSDLRPYFSRVRSLVLDLSDAETTSRLFPITSDFPSLKHLSLNVTEAAYLRLMEIREIIGPHSNCTLQSFTVTSPHALPFWIYNNINPHEITTLGASIIPGAALHFLNSCPQLHIVDVRADYNSQIRLRTPHLHEAILHGHAISCLPSWSAPKLIHLSLNYESGLMNTDVFRLPALKTLTLSCLKTFEFPDLLCTIFCTILLNHPSLIALDIDGLSAPLIAAIAALQQATCVPELEYIRLSPDPCNKGTLDAMCLSLRDIVKIRPTITIEVATERMPFQTAALKGLQEEFPSASILSSKRTFPKDKSTSLSNIYDHASLND